MDIPIIVTFFLPDELMVNILRNYLDVRTLVEIKLVSRQWRILSTTAIDSKGIGTTRKAFETHHELREAVKRYCPLPDGRPLLEGEIDDTSTTQIYCNRETAEDIARTYGWPINKWNVSNIENFTGIFMSQVRYNGIAARYECLDGIVLFNESIKDWDTSMAVTMKSMFRNAAKFNQTISTWDVSNVRNMTFMFTGTKMFNEDLSSWDVSNVTTMLHMFSDTPMFNQDLSSWDVSNVTTMSRMFSDTQMFNQDLSSWDVSSVTNMAFMFSNAQMFNQNLSTWDVSNVTTMYRMFSDTQMFHQDVSSWGERWQHLEDE